MFITLNIENFKEKNILLNDPVKNILRVGCDFIKIIYSDENMIINGIYINITFKNIDIIKKKVDMYKLKMNREENIDEIKSLTRIEEIILGMINKDLIKSYNLRTELLKLKLIKLHGQINLNDGNYNKMDFVIRIFGIWCDNLRCGLNYQIIPRTEKYLVNKGGNLGYCH